MGGPGSSRWRRYSKKILVDNCLVLSIVELSIKGFFFENSHNIKLNSEQPILLEYCKDHNLIRITYPKLTYTIPIISRSGPNGGIWLSFGCPFIKENNEPCGNRVLKLYCPRNSDIFGCRVCHNLSYKSQQTWDKRKSKNYQKLPFDINQYNSLEKIKEALIEILHGGSNINKALNILKIAYKHYYDHFSDGFDLLMVKEFSRIIRKIIYGKYIEEDFETLWRIAFIFDEKIKSGGHPTDFIGYNSFSEIPIKLF